MAVSHSLAGEHIEDGGDEKADAKRDHRDIKHVISSAGILQILEILHSAPANVRGAIVIQINQCPLRPPR
jgi:hypothetical protein